MFKSFKSFLISFVISGLICFFLIWSFAERAKRVNYIKQEIVKIQTSLNEAGYDLAYENLQFSQLPFFILKINDLKVYSLDSKDYFELHIPEIKVNTGMFNFNELKIKTSFNQYVQSKGKTYIVDFPSLNINLGFDVDGILKSFTVTGKDMNIENLISIADLKIASQRMAPKQINEFTPFFENHVEAKGIRLADNIKFPVSRFVDRFYLNANIIGVVKEESSYKQSIMSWLTRGGIIDVKKLILNCEFLNLVGRGDLYFNENLEPNLHLTASAKGLQEFIQALQNKDLLDNKGAFVVKILLGSKAFKVNEDDKYNTVTTPINITPHEVSVENISIMKF